MHIEYLYYFRDFSKSLSISKTAAEYYMTPQGLSRALHQLEKDFGITLMAYNNNAVTLTPAGKELAERVEGIIAQYDDARGALTKYKLSEIAPSQGIVRVTVTSCVSRYLLTLLGLQQPGLFPFAVKVNEANIYRLIPHLLSRENEDCLGIVSFPATNRHRQIVEAAIEEEDLVYRPLAVSPLVAVVSEFSPLSSKKVITPKDLDSCQIARYRDTVLGDALDDYVREDNIKTITNASSVVYDQVIEHQAVSFAPKLAEGMRTLPQHVVLKPTEGLFSTEFGVLVAKRNISSANVDRVLDYIEQKLEEERGKPRYFKTFEMLSS